MKQTDRIDRLRLPEALKGEKTLIITRGESRGMLLLFTSGQWRAFCAMLDQMDGSDPKIRQLQRWYYVPAEEVAPAGGAVEIPETLQKMFEGCGGDRSDSDVADGFEVYRRGHVCWVAELRGRDTKR